MRLLLLLDFMASWWDSPHSKETPSGLSFSNGELCCCIQRVLIHLDGAAGLSPLAPGRLCPKQLEGGGSCYLGW